MTSHFGNAVHNREVVAKHWDKSERTVDRHLRVALVDTLLALVVEMQELRATILQATDPQRAEKEAQEAEEEAKRDAERKARWEEREKWQKIAEKTEIVKHWQAFVEQQPKPPRVAHTIWNALTFYGGKEIAQMSMDDFIAEIHKPKGGTLRYNRNMGKVSIQVLRDAFPRNGNGE